MPWMRPAKGYFLFRGHHREDTAGTVPVATSLVNIDCFAEIVPLAVDDMLAEIEGYFAAYLT